MSDLTLPIVPDLWWREGSHTYESWLEEVCALAPVLDEAQRAASLQIMRCFALQRMLHVPHPNAS